MGLQLKVVPLSDTACSRAIRAPTSWMQRRRQQHTHDNDHGQPDLPTYYYKTNNTHLHNNTNKHMRLYYQIHDHNCETHLWINHNISNTQTHHLHWHRHHHHDHIIKIFCQNHYLQYLPNIKPLYIHRNGDHTTESYETINHLEEQDLKPKHHHQPLPFNNNNHHNWCPLTNICTSYTFNRNIDDLTAKYNTHLWTHIHRHKLLAQFQPMTHRCYHHITMSTGTHDKHSTCTFSFRTAHQAQHCNIYFPNQLSSATSIQVDAPDQLTID